MYFAHDWYQVDLAWWKKIKKKCKQAKYNNADERNRKKWMIEKMQRKKSEKTRKIEKTKKKYLCWYFHFY